MQENEIKHDSVQIITADPSSHSDTNNHRPEPRYRMERNTEKHRRSSSIGKLDFIILSDDMLGWYYPTPSEGW